MCVITCESLMDIFINVLLVCPLQRMIIKPGTAAAAIFLGSILSFIFVKGIFVPFLLYLKLFFLKRKGFSQICSLCKASCNSL